MSIKNVISKNGVWKTAPLNDASSSGGVLVVTDTNGTLDKTWQEIHDAFVAGSVRIQKPNGAGTALMNVKVVNYSPREGYSLACDLFSSIEAYEASSADGYPVAQ